MEFLYGFDFHKIINKTVKAYHLQNFIFINTKDLRWNYFAVWMLVTSCIIIGNFFSID
jgi:hypothetical protein